MGDVPIRPEPEPEPTAVERVNATASAAIAAALPGVSARRGILFLLVAVALVLNVPAVGIVALVILALTDQVVPL